ncbi:mscS Mechanosensitive ion channel domain protein [Mycobacterium ulcerans str. Harvey]|uniref:MscS Mechanosensitive ion channel domain protein n=1 Tax=Mycobacterium ulcerans str. Harvey TaxID=1299332 RepID=A0ABN0R9X9_MYCUL|nr:mscS Mechanosensitive ion channel domain protein [Mycobacterium ulcerans str. Harvey]
MLLLIAAITWLVASLVLVAERRAINQFGGGDATVTDADLHATDPDQVTTLHRLAVAAVVLLGLAAALMTFPPSPRSARPVGLRACCRWWPVLRADSLGAVFAVSR